MDTYGTVKGKATTLRQAILPILRLAAALGSPGGCSIYELAREMVQRHATDAVDQVAGLPYLLRVTELPIYDAKVSAEKAWTKCFNVLPLRRKNELLFDFPYRGTNQGWVPSWRQLLEWPELNPEYDHTPTPSSEESRPLEIVDLSLISDKRAFFLSEIWGISQVHIRRESGRYDIYVNERPFGFYCPYFSQTPLDVVPDQLYTLANLEVGYANNWVVCEVIKKQNMNCKLRRGKATGSMSSSEVEVEVELLRKRSRWSF